MYYVAVKKPFFLFLLPTHYFFFYLLSCSVLTLLSRVLIGHPPMTPRLFALPLCLQLEYSF